MTAVATPATSSSPTPAPSTPSTPSTPSAPSTPGTPGTPAPRQQGADGGAPGLGRPFGHLLVGTGASNLADGVLMVGVPLLALELTRSPGQLSLLSTAATLPWLLLALHAGLVLDRRDRVTVLRVAAAVRVLVLAAATVLAVTDRLSLPALVGLAFLLGSAEVFADSAATVIVPSVVPRERLGAAYSRLMGVQQVANAFLGGPLAGLLLALGAGWLFGIPAALCLVTVLAVVRGLSRRATPESAPTDGIPARRSVRAELTEGLHFLRHHPVVRPLLVTGTVLNFAISGYLAVFVLWVVGPGSRVGLDARYYGLLPAALAVGAVVGAVVAERLARRLGEARLIHGAWAANVLLLAVPVLVPHPVAIAAAFLLVGLVNTVGNVVGQAMRQRLVPDRMLGRVGGVSRTISYGSMPLGAATAGLVAELWGLPAVLLGTVVLGAVFVVRAALRVGQADIDAAEVHR